MRTNTDPENQSLHLNAIWLADVQIGSRDYRDLFLLDFPERTRCDVLYLTGAVIEKSTHNISGSKLSDPTNRWREIL